MQTLLHFVSLNNIALNKLNFSINDNEPILCQMCDICVFLNVGMSKHRTLTKMRLAVSAHAEKQREF